MAEKMEQRSRGYWLEPNELSIGKFSGVRGRDLDGEDYSAGRARTLEERGITVGDGE